MSNQLFLRGGGGRLSNLSEEFRVFFGEVDEILFIPWAVKDCATYVRNAQEALFDKLGYRLLSLHEVPNPKEAVLRAKAFCVPGGNTFRLLWALYDNDLIDCLRKQIMSGVPYAGDSAGANIVCPTIKTTNDMPIVYPPSLNALNVLPFQINPHYFDSDPDSPYEDETREERIEEYHEENNLPVVGLREDSWLSIRGSHVTLWGIGARVFLRGRDAKDYGPAESLDFLMG